MLASGTWTGTLTDGRASRPVTTTVERCAAGFEVALTADGRTVRTRTATYRRGHLAFALAGYRSSRQAAPRTLRCELQMQPDGSLAGACTAGRAHGELRLTPPANGDVGCS